ncbi:hypothetical protein [Nostoc sp.]
MLLNKSLKMLGFVPQPNLLAVGQVGFVQLTDTDVIASDLQKT